MSFNIFVFHEFVKNCFIFVQTASSSVFIACYALFIPLFHKLFNKTVEKFLSANRTSLL